MITQIGYFDWDTRSMKSEPIKELRVGYKTPTGTFLTREEAQEECGKNDFILENVAEYVVIALGEHGMEVIESTELARANTELAKLTAAIEDIRQRWTAAEVKLSKYRSASLEAESILRNVRGFYDEG